MVYTKKVKPYLPRKSKPWWSSPRSYSMTEETTGDR